jgi:1-acyl-sn-glycerol-3-phosphate acyltransferase
LKGPTSYPNPLLKAWRLAPGVQRAGLWYRSWRMSAHVVYSALWGLRIFDRRHEPAGGSAVYICNHQSFLDPAVCGLGLRRPLNYMARDSLFRFPIFGRLIHSFNAFPVKRNSADIGAIKEGIRRLKEGGQLVVFAEGTRTTDGRIGTLLPGAAMFAQRVADWTVPVVIDGAIECWPRWQMLPLPGSIAVRYGRPIPRAKAKEMEPQAFLDRVRRMMIELQADMRRRLGKPPIEY